MASKNKLKKLKNAYHSGGALKNNQGHRLKRGLFFTAAERKALKRKLWK